MEGKLRIGAFTSYLSLAVSIITGIFYTPWMIRSVGVHDYGLYVLALSIINIFVFDFGFGQAIQYFVSKYRAKNRLDRVNQFLAITYKLYIGFDIIVFVLLFSVYFFIPEIYQGLSTDELVKFKFIYSSVAIFSILSFPFVHLDGTILAHEKFFHLKLCDIFHQIIVVTSMTLFLYFGFGLYALVFVSIFAGILKLLMKLYILKRYTEVRVTWRFWDLNVLRLILFFSMWSAIYVIAQRGVLTVAPSILSIYHNSRSVAILGVTFTLEGFFFLFANSINGLFLPKVSKLISQKDTDEITSLMIEVGRIQIFLTGAIYIGLICFGRHFISIWVGEQFSIVYLSAIIMISPSFISLAQNIGFTAIIATGKIKFLAYSGILQALTNLILIFPLAKNYGSLGVSISVGIAYFVSLVFNNLVYIHALHLNMKKYFKSTIIRFIPTLLLSLVFGFILNFCFVEINWFTLVLKIGLFVLIYVSLFFMLALNFQERKKIYYWIKSYVN